jgi:hypothetical protein
MKNDPITIELLRRTVFDMKRMPENEHKSLKDLARPAYELLRELERTIAHFEEEECTFHEGVKIVTGYKRVREAQIKIFELFYEQTYDFDSGLSSNQRSENRYQVRHWREIDAIPLRWCYEAAPKFAKWNARRRREIEHQKHIGSSKPKYEDF